MTGIKILDTQKLNLYSFKAISTSKKVADEISVDLLFYARSPLVASLQPKRLLKENSASTTAAKETPLEKSFEAIIDNTSYTVTGINLVHFENNHLLLAIQVISKIPEDVPNVQQWAKSNGTKFAKYIINKGYVDKARIKSKELDKTLMDQIGVSFLDPGTGRGFNVLLKPEEYK